MDGAGRSKVLHQQYMRTQPLRAAASPSGMSDANASASVVTASVVAAGNGAAEARANNVTKRMEKTLICILRNWTDG